MCPLESVSLPPVANLTAVQAVVSVWEGQWTDVQHGCGWWGMRPARPVSGARQLCGDSSSQSTRRRPEALAMFTLCPVGRLWPPLPC